MAYPSQSSVPLFGERRIASPSSPPVVARIDGWPIHLQTLPSTIEHIVRAARAQTGFTVFTLNLDHLVKLRTSTAFQDAYRRADLVTADGEPVAWLARFQAPGVRRTTGADLFVPVVRAAAQNGLPIYLFGSTLAVLKKTQDRLSSETRGQLTVAGIASPSDHFDPEGLEADRAIDAITASGARLCFVALGAPKQEVFAARAVARGCKAGFICIGAAVDFVAGAQVRAPAVFQRYGMEWAWRLASNPRRLAKRYADCARVLVDVAVFAPMRRGIAAREI
jgi:exopolysaccharide biosynthesis WecB/TagA/CpsF family protein